MKIITWNVNGIRARAEQVAALVEREAPDVLCLQEIKAAPPQIPVLLCEPAGYWCHWHGETSYSGVALQIRRSVAPERPEFVHPPFDHENRVVTARAGDVLVASIYVPNGGKDFPAKMRFLEALERWVGEVHASGLSLVLCGDLNVARTDKDVHPKERKTGMVGQRTDERAALERILGHGLVDVGRAMDPDNDQLFTWWAPWRNLRQRNIGWRIDYVLASESLAKQTTRSASLREFGTSDHAPVVVTFD